MQRVEPGLITRGVGVASYQLGQVSIPVLMAKNAPLALPLVL